MFPAYYIFNGLLSILLVLHVIWTYFILKMAYFSVYAKEVQLHPPPYGINKMFPDIYVKPFSNLIPCFFSKFLYFMVKVWPRGIWLWQWITNSYCNVKPSRWRLSHGATIILARLRINSISKHLKGRWRHGSDTFLGLVTQSIAVGYAKVLPVLPSANRITLCKWFWFTLVTRWYTLVAFPIWKTGCCLCWV